MNEKLHLKIVINSESGVSVTHLDIEKNLINYCKLRQALENFVNIPQQATVTTNMLDSEEKLPLENDSDLKKILNTPRKTMNGFTIYVSNEKKDKNISNKNPVIQSVTHHSVLCNNCHSIIIGNRFNCLECIDFDLCNSCFSTNVHNNEHSMIVIRSNILSPLVHKMMTTCHKELKYEKQQAKPSPTLSQTIRRRYSETPNYIDNRFSTSPMKQRPTLS